MGMFFSDGSCGLKKSRPDTGRRKTMKGRARGGMISQANHLIAHDSEE